MSELKSFHFPGKNILVVEDNFDSQELMKDMLEALQCQIDLASDGEEALKKFKEHKYDLILLDIQMPEMDGYQVAVAIRKLENKASHVPIIALTANALVGERERCLQAGMDGYISKPIDIDIIEEKLNNVFSFFEKQ